MLILVVALSWTVLLLRLPVVLAFSFSVLPRRQQHYHAYGWSRRHSCSATTITATLAASSSGIVRDENNDDNDSLNGALTGKTVLVVGGSGRVGGSVVTQLLQAGCSHVTVGGTSADSFAAAKSRNGWPNDDARSSVDFEVLDKTSADTVVSLLANKDYDLVVHTAGPFQGKSRVTNGVLEAALQQRVPYVDVCDDYCTAMAAKSKYAKTAQEEGVPCIVSTGCWPGVSSLMAKQLVDKVLCSQQQQAASSNSNNSSTTSLTTEDLTVDFSFFTAGSGGAGATLLVATFLILAEEALTVVDGRRRPVKAMKDYESVWFGDIVGEKQVANLNLLETASIHDVLGVSNVRSLFGTAPAFWNALLGLMAQLPSSLLSNEELMSKLAVFSLPIVRLVDAFAGATNAMRCDVSCPDRGIKATAIYAHENLEPCVGECVTAFCAAVLRDGVVPPGVWCPEEAISAGADAAAVLKFASVGAHTVQVESKELDIACEEVWGRPQQ